MAVVHDRSQKQYGIAHLRDQLSSMCNVVVKTGEETQSHREEIYKIHIRFVINAHRKCLQHGY